MHDTNHKQLKEKIIKINLCTKVRLTPKVGRGQSLRSNLLIIDADWLQKLTFRLE